MDRSIAELFVILAINPEKGHGSLNDIHFCHVKGDNQSYWVKRILNSLKVM